MLALRRALPLAVVGALACTGRVDQPPAAPARPAEAPAGDRKAEPIPPDPGDALAATLTEEKLLRLLASEEEIVPLTADLVALASLPGAGPGAGVATREERVRSVEARIDAALAKRGLTRADHAGFAALSDGLLLRAAKAEEARAQLAANADSRKAAPRGGGADAGKRTSSRPVIAPGRPLPELVVRDLQLQIAQADAERKELATRHGDPVLALLDRHRARFLAIRESRVRAVLGQSTAR